MKLYADLHIHSKYSRACSRDCDLEHLSWWARRKGITVIGTGDFTHPAWAEELRAKLVPAEPGLFRLRDDLDREVLRTLPRSCHTPVRFLLEVEISTIYKRAERTRKVHHLCYVPDLDAAAAFAKALGRIGNIGSDGRPILGLDSRDLLEVTLEAGEGSFLIPAHVWTPWFAVLGSKSGFDRVEDCYADLADHITAVETGLSSDPEMNWQVSRLDRYRLTSNSDAHSPPMLGRNATLFDIPLDYHALRRALADGPGYVGTLDLFPEEGKYHLDGHRACDVRLSPAQSRAHGNDCPACGKPLTIGVLHRVQELADRPSGEHRAGGGPPPPATAGKAVHVVPLPEIVGEILGVGPKSKAVAAEVDAIVHALGPELAVLCDLPLDEIAAARRPLLVEAVDRLRHGAVHREGGYDGVYGTISLFEPGELGPPGKGRSLSRRLGGAPGTEDAEPTLFDLPPAAAVPAQRRDGARRARPAAPPATVPAPRPAPEDALPPGAAFAAPPAATDALPGMRAGLEADLGPAEPPSAEAASPDHTSADAESTDVTSVRGSSAAADAPSPAAEVARGDHRRSADAPSSPLLDALDPDQRAAAAHTGGPLLIIAGPGTGKTRTLTHRIAHLVTACGVPAREVLAVTFTRRAREEMRERLAALVPHHVGDIDVTTFHRLGLSLIREQAALLGLAPDVRVADEPQRLAALHAALASGAGGTAARDTAAPREARRLLAAISRARRGGADAADAELAAAYTASLRAGGLLDFDDLVALPVALLTGHPELVAHYRARYRWISVDEYQDVDELQYRLLRLLAPPEGNLTAIGDPDQAIYSFRGADVGFFLRFRDDFPGARTVELTRNYRSSPVIVAGALAAIAPASLVPGRTLLPARAQPPGAGPSSWAERVTVHVAPDEAEEAAAVVRTIEVLLGGSSFHARDSGVVVDDGVGGGLAFDDIAVLYRTDAQTRPLIEALTRAGVPFQKRSHDRLTDRPGVRELLRHLDTPPVGPPGWRNVGGHEADGAPAAAPAVPAAADAPVLFAPADDDPDAPALAEVPVPEQLRQAARRAALAQEGAEADAADAEKDGRADLDRLSELHAAVELLMPLAEAYAHDRARFLAEIELGAEVDTWDPRADRISLLTLHAAKGLEFPVVFLLGCEDGLLPLRFPGRGSPSQPQAAAAPDQAPAAEPPADAAAEAEERRLFFVGVSRAQTHLYVSHAARRTRQGQVREARPSPFLADLERARTPEGSPLVERTGTATRRARDRQLRML